MTMHFHQEEPVIPCGPNADDRYCANYWELSAERDRLRTAVAELLDNTGLDDDQQAEWLERAGITLTREDGHGN